MNLLCKNILLNLSRDNYRLHEKYYYICINCISAINAFDKISFPFLVYSGEGFFYQPSHGANLFLLLESERPISFNKSSVAFFIFHGEKAFGRNGKPSISPFFYYIIGKSVFLAFQIQKESPNFRPTGLLDQVNRMLANGNHLKEIFFKGAFSFSFFLSFFFVFLLKQ